MANIKLCWISFFYLFYVGVGHRKVCFSNVIQVFLSVTKKFGNYRCSEYDNVAFSNWVLCMSY